MKISLIISFNPDIELLKKNINIISKIMDKIFIIDNNSNNNQEILEIKKACDTLKIVSLEENVGIAKATNIGFEYISSLSNWVLLLDQDSILHVVDIQRLYRFTEKNIYKLGMIVPTYVDRNDNNYLPSDNIHENQNFHLVNYPIASGSLVNVHAWSSVGGYDNDLFIDRVDDDFDLRLRNFGYRLVQVDNAIIDHEIGQINIINLFGKKIKIYNHNAFRKYYQSRNNIIFAKKHGGIVNALKRNIVLIFKTLLFEKQKKNKLKNIYKGTKDGINYKT